MTYLLFDLAMIAVLALYTFLGWRKGFILTLCSLLAIFVAWIGATVVSNALAEPVSRLVQPAIRIQIERVMEESIEESLDDTRDVETSGDIAGMLDQVPLREVLDALEDLPLYRNLAEAFQDAVDSGVARVTAGAIDSLASYAARELARGALFFLSFAVILLVWLLLSHALDLVAKLPVLSQTNAFLGGALGLVKGVVILSIAAWLLKGWLIPQEAIEQTVLLRFFCRYSLLSLLEMAKSSANFPSKFITSS